jgi:hypothetical protein
MFTRILALALFASVAVPSALAQGVTTATLSGTIVDASGEPLPGATVVAVHEPTGTQYGTVARSDGRYSITNMQVGGPYTLTFSFVGYSRQVIGDVQLRLGETYVQNAALTSGEAELEEVVVTGAADRVFNRDRTGAATSIDEEAIARIPTINRSINDLTKLTPQSSGTSFAGRDNRFNNYTIDGSVYNNNFGLGDAQFAGGNPISLDVIEEVQVNLAPYDVREGGFTGANVNAVTRRGTNEYRGTAYMFYRNQDFVGTQIGDNEITVDDSFTRTMGASAGGPILRNRLFFFVNVEQEAADNPGDNRRALRPGESPDGTQITRVPLERAEFVRDQIRSLYGYDPGAFENLPFGDEALRLNARLDLNISPRHRAMLRFNMFDSFRDVLVNGNSIRGFPATERYLNTNRFGPEAITFRNAHYSTDSRVTSLVGELNSTFGANLANSFRVSQTWATPQERGYDGGVFPFIEVMEPLEGNPNVYYMSLGNELFTVGNLLRNNTLSASNTVTYFGGRHTITGGAHFEYMTFDNAFNPVWNSWYRYASYDDFVESVINQNPDVRPSHFAIAYTYDANNPTVLPLDEVNFAQVGLYIQDEFQVTPSLRITAGLRADLPFYPMDAPRNPAVEALNLSIPNPRGGDNITPDVSAFPSLNPLWSPRVGFNWDVMGDRTTQLRGGSGIFSGRLPFVWISNQINANGVTRGQLGIMADEWGTGGFPEWQGFQSDPNVYRPDPSQIAAEVPTQINITADDFRLPQVWRTNLAVDQRLPNGAVGSLELIFARDYNSPLAVNLANRPTGAVANVAGHEYQLFEQRIDRPDGTNSGIREMYYLTNLNRGDYFSATLGGEHTWDFGLFTSLYYTYSRARDYGLIGGSQAQSLWPNVVRNDRNNPELGFSRFDAPNRIVAQIGYDTRILTANHLTRFSLFYVGGDQGRYSYTYAGSFGDGNGVRLMYVPRTFEEAQLIDRVDGDGNLVQSAQQQWSELDALIENDPYLRGRRGQVTERNGARLPWLNRIDLRIAQDVGPFTVGGQHALQLTLDVLNFGNLLSNIAGVTRSPVQTNLLRYQGVDSAGNAQFTLNPPSGGFSDDPFVRQININNTWSAQLGFRYRFN